MSTQSSTSNPTADRLEDQIQWYDKKSRFNQAWFKRLKILQILCGAGVPLAAGQGVTPWVTGGLGALIVVLEGLQSLNQFHQNWNAYRSTCEHLKHEKFLWLAKAGPYRDEAEPDKLMAERVEALISTEHAKWIGAKAEHQRPANR